MKTTPVKRRTNTTPRRVWEIVGIPKVQLVQTRHNGKELIIAARFSLGIDVPAKPRTTQRAKWVNEAYLSYMDWRKIFRLGIQTALEALDQPTLPVPLFSAVTALEPKIKRSKMNRVPPLLILGTLATKLEGDFDNREKSICDAVNGLLWSDDREVAGGGLTVVNAEDSRADCHFAVLALPQENRRQQVLDLWKPISISWPKDHLQTIAA